MTTETAIPVTPQDQTSLTIDEQYGLPLEAIPVQGSLIRRATQYDPSRYPNLQADFGKVALALGNNSPIHFMDEGAVNRILIKVKRFSVRNSLVVGGFGGDLTCSSNTVDFSIEDIQDMPSNSLSVEGLIGSYAEGVDTENLPMQDGADCLSCPLNTMAAGYKGRRHYGNGCYPTVRVYGVIPEQPSMWDADNEQEIFYTLRLDKDRDLRAFSALVNWIIKEPEDTVIALWGEAASFQRANGDTVKYTARQTSLYTGADWDETARSLADTRVGTLSTEAAVKMAIQGWRDEGVEDFTLVGMMAKLPDYAEADVDAVLDGLLSIGRLDYDMATSSYVI